MLSFMFIDLGIFVYIYNNVYVYTVLEHIFLLYTMLPCLVLPCLVLHCVVM